MAIEAVALSDCCPGVLYTQHSGFDYDPQIQEERYEMILRREMRNEGVKAIGVHVQQIR